LSTNQRGITVSNWRYVVENISLTIENGYGYCDVTLLPETAGLPASTYTPATLPTIVNTFPFAPIVPTLPSLWEDLLPYQESMQNGLIVTVNNGDLDDIDDGIEDGTFNLHGGAVLCYTITQYINNCMAVAYKVEYGSTLSGSIDLQNPNILFTSGVFLPLGTDFNYTYSQILTAWQDDTAIDAVRCVFEGALANQDVTTTIFANALNGYSGGANDTIIANVVDMFNNFYGNLYAFVYALKQNSFSSSVGTVAEECDCTPCLDITQLFQTATASEWVFLPTNGTTSGTFFLTDGSSFGGEPYLLAGEHRFSAGYFQSTSFVKILGIDPTCQYSGATLDLKLDNTAVGDSTNAGFEIWDTDPPYANYLTYITETGYLDSAGYLTPSPSTNLYVTLTLSFTPQVFSQGYAVIAFGASGGYSTFKVRCRNFRLTE